MIDGKDKARIEAAIRYFQKKAQEYRDKGNPEFVVFHAVLWDTDADLLRWVLGQDQETWTGEELGLKSKKEA